jgi:hypothetical protein
MRTMRGLCSVIVTVLFAVPVLAEQDDQGWTLSERFQGNSRSVREKEQEHQAAFVKTMNAFVTAEGLIGIIEPSYVCQRGTEVCGRVDGNLEELLRERPDFLPDTYNFHKAHPGSTCSYRGKSGSSHYSLHVVCYGNHMAGVHVDVRLPQGWWGSIEHNVRDVAENYFKIYVMRMKSSHTSEMQLARNFSKWWRSYQTAYPGLAARGFPREAEGVLNSQTPKSSRTESAAYAQGFR